MKERTHERVCDSGEVPAVSEVLCDRSGIDDELCECGEGLDILSRRRSVTGHLLGLAFLRTRRRVCVPVCGERFLFFLPRREFGEGGMRGREGEGAQVISKMFSVRVSS